MSPECQNLLQLLQTGDKADVLLALSLQQALQLAEVQPWLDLLRNFLTEEADDEAEAQRLRQEDDFFAEQLVDYLGADFLTLPKVIGALCSGSRFQIKLAIRLVPLLQAPELERLIARFQAFLVEQHGKDPEQLNQDQNYLINSISKNIGIVCLDNPGLLRIRFGHWGGMGYGYELPEHWVRADALNFIHLEDSLTWVKSKEAEELREHYSYHACQLWVTFRYAAEMAPILEMLFEHWPLQRSRLAYYLAEIYIELEKWTEVKRCINYYLSEEKELFTKGLGRERWEDFEHLQDFRPDHLRWLYDHPRFHSFPPNRLEALGFLAQVARAEGELGQALAYYREAIALAPGHWLAPHQDLACLLLAQGELEAAAQALWQDWQNLQSRNYNESNLSLVWAWMQEAKDDTYPRLVAYLNKRYPWLVPGMGKAERIQLCLVAAQTAGLTRVLRLSFLHLAAEYLVSITWKNSQYPPEIKALIGVFRQQALAIYRQLRRYRNGDRVQVNVQVQICTMFIKSEIVEKNWPEVHALFFQRKAELIWLHFRDRWQLANMGKRRIGQVLQHLPWRGDALRFWRYLGLYR